VKGVLLVTNIHLDMVKLLKGGVRVSGCGTPDIKVTG
jgi:hypothetical protein